VGWGDDAGGSTRTAGNFGALLAVEIFRDAATAKIVGRSEPDGWETVNA